MLTLADGRTFWPSFSARRLQKIEDQFPDALDSLSRALRAGPWKRLAARWERGS
jgi:Flp pilus assembly protein TadB